MIVQSSPPEIFTAEIFMLASFSIIPIGEGEELKELIAKAVSIIDKSGLPYKLGAMQTTIEGKQEEVLSVIMECHNELLKEAPRVLTHITIDDRKGAEGRLEGKVSDVRKILGDHISHE